MRKTIPRTPSSRPVWRFADPRRREEMMEKLTDMAATALTADAALDDVIFSWILDRETELAAEVEAGLLMEHELDVVRALLRLILSPNVRMPLSRLQ
jgi:hypothetical protein